MKYYLITTDSTFPLSENEELRELLLKNGLDPEEAETITLGTNGLIDSDCRTSGSADGPISPMSIPAVCDELTADLKDADLVIFSGGAAGDELACRLSMRTGGSVLTAARDFAFDGDSLLVSRKTYAGHMMGTWRLESRPWCISLSSAPSYPTEGANLADADCILAAGRGVGSPKGAAKVAEHAARLGLELGASRPVVMSAWLPMDRLLGVSGTITSPRLVIACGVSGAPAFVSGIESADTIIAINSDADAPIMSKSDLAITGDWDAILSELTHPFSR